MSHERFKAEILPIRDHLFHTARQILSDEDDAEDAVQEVLLRLWNLRDTLGKYDSLPAFATTVTSVFQSQKGPNIQAVSLGAMLHF